MKNNTSPGTMRAFATVATRSQLAQVLLEREHKVRTHEDDDRSTKLPRVGPKILIDDLPGFDSIRSALDGTWERFARRSVSE